MHEFISSQVAAACLLAARLEHGVIPVWPKVVANVTGYTLPDLQECLDLLIELVFLLFSCFIVGIVLMKLI